MTLHSGVAQAAGSDIGSYVLRVRDTGMGMSPEFAATVFEAYSRERTASHIQGTGLGMAITKNIVDLMGGQICVETEQGKGTEFIISVDFPITDSFGEADTELAADTAQHIAFTPMKILLVDDNEINREIATMLLEESGFTVESAENGQIAFDIIAASQFPVTKMADGVHSRHFH